MKIYYFYQHLSDHYLSVQKNALQMLKLNLNLSGLIAPA